MDFLKSEIIKLAREQFPNAETDIEALDNFADKLYKDLQSKPNSSNFYFENELDIHLYHVVNRVRKDELQRVTEAVSDYKISVN